MRWYPKKDKLGDVKVTTHFAWTPVRLSSGTMIWLERYKKKYRYENVERNIWRAKIVLPVNTWVLDSVY
jgi:hypothetical protein